MPRRYTRGGTRIGYDGVPLKPIRIEVKPSTHMKLGLRAREQGVTQAILVRNVLEDYLRQAEEIALDTDALMAMRARDAVNAYPFQPFVIKVTDGRTYTIKSREFVLLAPGDRERLLVADHDGIHQIDPLTVTALEPLDNEAAS
jgi:predicted DNA-binding protein